MKLEKIVEIAESLDWSVTKNGAWYEFSKYSPAGEDFSFTVYDETGNDIAECVAVYVDGFDKDDHVEMWMEARRNGVDGVPTIRELVDDAEEIEKMLNELAESLEA